MISLVFWSIVDGSSRQSYVWHSLNTILPFDMVFRVATQTGEWNPLIILRKKFLFNTIEMFKTLGYNKIVLFENTKLFQLQMTLTKIWHLVTKIWCINTIQFPLLAAAQILNCMQYIIIFSFPYNQGLICMAAHGCSTPFCFVFSMNFYIFEETHKSLLILCSGAP